MKLDTSSAAAATKHLIDTQEFDRSELEDLLALIGLLKEADLEDALPELLPRCSLAMIFEEPSTRRSKAWSKRSRRSSPARALARLPSMR
jgi:ornithine carbamoyltransferase